MDVRWTSEASRNLEEIYSYIYIENPKAAEKTVSEIYSRVQLLKRHPEIGYHYEHRDRRDIRVILYGHYKIAYLKIDSNTLDILGVFHGAMDLSKHLKLPG